MYTAAFKEIKYLLKQTDANFLFRFDDSLQLVDMAKADLFDQMKVECSKGGELTESQNHNLQKTFEYVFEKFAIELALPKELTDFNQWIFYIMLQLPQFYYLYPFVQCY